MDNQMDKYIGQILDNRYEILEVIGVGGMAVVYRAKCHMLNRYVAVKILRDDLAVDSEFRRRFQTESKAVAMLCHPNIVTVYDVSRPGGVEYIVMELIEGISLKQYIRKKGALAWKETLHFASQIVSALSHAHGKGIIHRDIKPHNIMILKDGTIKVADFGIAHLQSAQAEEISETLGSVHYISPEQAKGGAVDCRTDIYSAGIVMYEMLTGKLPFDGDSDESVALSHLSKVPVRPIEINPDIPEELEQIVLTAMNPDLKERYESADAMLRDLDDFRKSQTAVLNGEAPKAKAGEGISVPYSDVRPIGTSGELSKEAYSRRKRRSRKVSMLSGFFGVLVVMVALFVFLWNFWLRGLFSEAERINVPSFVGSYVDEIIKNDTFLENFTFTVAYKVDPDTPEGMIISQNPEAGRSMMVVEEGIGITLTVSTGVKMVRIPDLINTEYRTAIYELETLGFKVETDTMANPTITKDYVISMNPSPNEYLASGSTVYVTVSGGPEVVYVSMPNLMGLSRSAAVDRIQKANLALGTISEVESDFTKGTVIWQSVSAYSEVEEHTKIYLQVSAGPKEETPPPATTPPASGTGPIYTGDPSTPITPPPTSGN